MILKMFKWINQTFDYFERNQKRSLLFFFILTVVLGFFATKLEKNIVIKDQIEKSSPDYKRLDYLEKNFEKHYRVPILLIGDISNNQNICKILLWLQNRVINDPNLITINSPFHLRSVNNTGDKLTYPTILPLECHKEQRIDYTALDNTPWRDIFTSTKHKDNLLFELLLQKEDITLSKKKFNSKVISSLDRDFSKFLKTEGLNYKFHLLSWASNRRYVHDGIKYTSILNMALFFIILILFRYFFGTFKSGILSYYFFSIYGNLSLWNDVSGKNSH